MSDQTKPSNFNETSYQLTSSREIESFLDVETNGSESFCIESPIVLRLVGKRLESHILRKSHIFYYLSNNENLYKMSFEKRHMEKDGQIDSLLNKPYYCYKRYDVDEMLLLGNIVQFTNLRFYKHENAAKNDDDELWQKGSFRFFQDTEIKVVGVEPVEEYPEKDSKYLPIWRDLFDLSLNDESDSLFMRVRLLDRIGLPSKRGAEKSKIIALIGDRNGHKCNLHVDFMHIIDYDCELVEKLRQCQEGQELIVTCARFFKDVDEIGLELCSPEHIIIVKEPIMKFKKSFIDVPIKRDNPLPLKDRNANEKPDPGLLVKGLAVFLPIVSKPAASKYGHWLNSSRSCECDNMNAWVSYCFQKVSVPLYKNTNAAKFGLEHHAVTVYFTCLKCKKLELKLTIDKGGSGIYCITGYYERIIQSEFHFKRLMFKEIVEEVKKHKDQYELLSDNCQHFSEAFFNAILALKSTEPLEQLYDPEFKSDNQCECESKDDLISYKFMQFFFSVYKKEDEDESAVTYNNYAFWFKCQKCEKCLIHVAENDHPSIIKCNKEYEMVKMIDVHDITRSGGIKDKQHFMALINVKMSFTEVMEELDDYLNDEGRDGITRSRIRLGCCKDDRFTNNAYALKVLIDRGLNFLYYKPEYSTVDVFDERK